MSVLIDTPIWSLALRRKKFDLSDRDARVVAMLQELIQRGQVQLLGSVRQEVLSGIREDKQFRKIRDYLRGFADVFVAVEDFEEAAELSNQCRRVGISSSTVDMLICASALRNGWQIFSTDQDFRHYSKAIPIQLLSVA